MTAMMKSARRCGCGCEIFTTASGFLTPAHYAPLSQVGSHPEFGLEYLEVRVVKVMLPYAIVYHHNGRGWVRLWIDTRETALFSVNG